MDMTDQDTSMNLGEVFERIDHIASIHFSGRVPPAKEARQSRKDLRFLEVWDEGLADEVKEPKVFGYLALCYHLGIGTGRPLPETSDLAKKFADQAVEMNDPTGQMVLGKIYWENRSDVFVHGGDGVFVKDDYELAYSLFKQSAEQGNAKAYCDLGLMYRAPSAGMAGGHDYPKAVECYGLAAHNNHPMAQCELGFMYMHGYGVTEDTGIGIDLITQSANNGYAPAQCYLAATYLEHDVERGLQWCRLAALQGHGGVPKLIERTIRELVTEMPGDTGTSILFLTFNANAGAHNLAIQKAKSLGADCLVQVLETREEVLAAQL